MEHKRLKSCMEELSLTMLMRKDNTGFWKTSESYSLIKQALQNP